MKESVLNIQNLNFYYGEKQALYNINIEVAPKQVTAFIGPSGCGKSTLLRCINRMNDLIDNTKTEGAIKFLGENIYDEETDVIELRRKVGMVFQKSNPFPKSIFENVVYGLRIAGITDKKKLKEAAEIMQRAALWDEVKDLESRVPSIKMGLSGSMAMVLAIHNLCICPPESPIAECFNLSFTSSLKRQTYLRSFF